MSGFRYSFAVVILVLAAAPSARAGDREARQWLERMSEALATRSYEGRYVQRDARSTTMMQIIHRVDKGRVTERLVSLDGSGRELISNQTEVIHYIPDRRTVVVSKRNDSSTLLAAVPVYNEELEAHYSIERGESTKELGRRTQVILVQPRDQYRYGYRLWLDHETAIPLKSQLCDRNGRVIGQIQFAEVNFRDRIPADALKPAVATEGFRWVRQDASPPRVARSTSSWSVISPPAGFRLAAMRIQLIPGANAPVHQLVYSDGLASVSVFIEPLNSHTETSHGLMKVGAAFAYSVDMDGYHITVVSSEVPAATLEAIATGVTRQGARPAEADRSAEAEPSIREASGPPTR
jgi:sigma-E factor negative regulatory protein RseB